MAEEKKSPEKLMHEVASQANFDVQYIDNKAKSQTENLAVFFRLCSILKFDEIIHFQDRTDCQWYVTRDSTLGLYRIWLWNNKVKFATHEMYIDRPKSDMINYSNELLIAKGHVDDTEHYWLLTKENQIERQHGSFQSIKFDKRLEIVVEERESETNDNANDEQDQEE